MSETVTELTVEHSAGDRPDDYVACADCGTYSRLIGPITFTGEHSDTGDHVCRTCAERRGLPETTITTLLDQ